LARIDYVELPSATAHELTRAFYAKAFGWTFTNYGPDYSATTTGDVDVGLNGQPDDALAAPLPVIRVDDLEAAFAAVTASGGTIAKAIFSFPGGRRFHFIDPAGSELAVWSDR
jgi:predicted enzyme related to lactoylglutathione lyase